MMKKQVSVALVWRKHNRKEVLAVLAHAGIKSKVKRPAWPLPLFGILVAEDRSQEAAALLRGRVPSSDLLANARFKKSFYIGFLAFSGISLLYSFYMAPRITVRMLAFSAPYILARVLMDKEISSISHRVLWWVAHTLLLASCMYLGVLAVGSWTT